MKFFLPAVVVGLLFSACKNNASEPSAVQENVVQPPVSLTYNVVASYPHDTSSYTQGLIWQNNAMYEGTGLEGHSRLMKVDLKNGRATQSISLDPTVFGEGVTVLNNKIYQLTWETHKAYVYDLATFKKLQEFPWAHEGWGLTHIGDDLIVSTGESNLYFVDPATFKIKKTLAVSDNNGPVGNLNELEYINGSIYANVYLTDFIIRIDPANGHVTGKIDMSDLLQKSGKNVNMNDGLVLNGIAYDSTKHSVYVTGKKWPLLFEMKLN